MAEQLDRLRSPLNVTAQQRVDRLKLASWWREEGRRCIQVGAEGLAAYAFERAGRIAAEAA